MAWPLQLRGPSPVGFGFAKSRGVNSQRFAVPPVEPPRPWFAPRRPCLVRVAGTLSPCTTAAGTSRASTARGRSAPTQTGSAIRAPSTSTPAPTSAGSAGNRSTERPTCAPMWQGCTRTTLLWLGRWTSECGPPAGPADCPRQQRPRSMVCMRHDCGQWRVPAVRFASFCSSPARPDVDLHTMQRPGPKRGPKANGLVLSQLFPARGLVSLRRHTRPRSSCQGSRNSALQSSPLASRRLERASHRWRGWSASLRA